MNVSFYTLTLICFLVAVLSVCGPSQEGVCVVCVLGGAGRALLRGAGHRAAHIPLIPGEYSPHTSRGHDM